MRRIRWAPAAAEDLRTISDYLRENHPSLARPTIQRLYGAARSLQTLSNRGRPGLAPNTRELIVSPLPYAIVYGVDADFVHIFRIIHGAEERQ